MTPPIRLSAAAPSVILVALAATPALASDATSMDAPDLAQAFAARSSHLRSAPLVPQSPALRPALGAVRVTTDSLQDEGAEEGGSGDGLAVQEQSTGRKFDMELGFRGRYMSVPDSIIDIWFTDEDTNGYLYTEPRPQIHGYSVGIEFVVKSKVTAEESGGSNGIFYVQYVDNLMTDGYWDDNDDDFGDGDYLAPTDNLGMVALGANYAYELHMVKTLNTNGNFGMSMIVGGGLGVAAVIGDVEYWRPNAENYSWERYPDESAREGTKPIPPVLPIVDINLGFRFNFGDRFVIRIDGGLQDMLYVGGSLGLMF